MANDPEEDVDVLLRSDQKLLPGNEGLRGTSWDEGQDLDHLIFQREMRLVRPPTTAESSPREEEQGEVLFSSGLPENQALVNDFG